jgi:hypothetical protein
MSCPCTWCRAHIERRQAWRRRGRGRSGSGARASRRSRGLAELSGRAPTADGPSATRRRRVHIGVPSQQRRESCRDCRAGGSARHGQGRSGRVRVASGMPPTRAWPWSPATIGKLPGGRGGRSGRSSSWSQSRVASSWPVSTCSASYEVVVAPYQLVCRGQAKPMVVAATGQDAWRSPVPSGCQVSGAQSSHGLLGELPVARGHLPLGVQRGMSYALSACSLSGRVRGHPRGRLRGECGQARPQTRWTRAERRTCCRHAHTPACCQARKRRQQVTPLPQPISRGSISQGMPLLSTQMIPAKAARSGTRGRPPLGLGGAGGHNGALAFHSLSLTNGCPIPSAYQAAGF